MPNEICIDRFELGKSCLFPTIPIFGSPVITSRRPSSLATSFSKEKTPAPGSTAGSPSSGEDWRYRKVVSPGELKNPDVETSRDLESAVAGTRIHKNDFLNKWEDAVETSLQELGFILDHHAEAYALAEIHALTRGDSLIGQQLQPPDFFVRKSNQLDATPLGLLVEFDCL